MNYTGKNILIATMIIVAITMFYTYFRGHNDIKVQSEDLKEQVLKDVTIKESPPVSQLNSNSENKLADYDLQKSCGFSEKEFQESMSNIDYQSMSEKELAHIEKLLFKCQTWFDNLAVINDSDLKKIKLKKEEKDQILKELSIDKAYDDKILINAAKLVKHEDPDISGSALLYLLTYDNQFIIKIGEEMGTSDTSFLNGNLDISILYSCQSGLDCSPEGVFMQDMCVIDESACNLSVNSWLRQNKTINQYDDLMVSLSIINSILNSDWFQERDILNTIDT